MMRSGGRTIARSGEERAANAVGEIAEADHPQSARSPGEIWTDGERLAEVALARPPSRQKVAVEARQIAHAAGGEERRFQQEPEEYELIQTSSSPSGRPSIGSVRSPQNWGLGGHS